MAGRKKTAKSETPLMSQYQEIKRKHPDALLLFRVGDFYETFGEDAVRAAGVLGIVLTKRANGAASSVELAGFPYHSLDAYLPRLVRAGMRVAICEQLEDPKLTKSIVKRGVTEMVSPGVSYNEKVLDHRSNNFLASLFLEKDRGGIAFLDISTGEFLVACGHHDYLDKLLQSFRPAELVFPKNIRKTINQKYSDSFYTYALDDWFYAEDYCREKLTTHFGTKTLKGFGIEEMREGIIAAGAVLQYLADNRHDKLAHISTISRIEEEKYVWLDRFTLRNLEIFDAQNPDATTLAEVVDLTVSPVGSRMLKRWLALPLKEKKQVEERLNIVEFFAKERELCTEVSRLISTVGDLERIISRAAAQRINPRELNQLVRALDAVEELQKICAGTGDQALMRIAEQFNPCISIRERIRKEITADAPVLVSKGNVIAGNVSEELDELRAIAHSGKDYLQGIQQREIARTGITSLKVSFNNVFGYYLEVTNAHKEKVPADWIRKQTLVNAERYITAELKSYEEKILGAEEKIQALEEKLFHELVLNLTEFVVPVQHDASLVARLDCLTAFAALATKYNYCRPVIHENTLLTIRQGRHPVIERQLPPGEQYVANDIHFDHDCQIMMITGPNMSGKSALLRQTALIVLLAQTGCFVPADSADIGLVDKIFTRVGASDNLSSGESTFMVEMNETASILNNMSDRSLILLDEIGRGTSTYDGISIAWAIAEYLHENGRSCPKTLFATHYHELNDMESRFQRIRNFNVSVKEVGDKVIFLRKLVPGGSEHSFGIHVAEMAGMPKPVLQRAKEILSGLEKSHSGDALNATHDKAMQLSFFQLDDPLLERLREDLLRLEIDTLTPVEALMKLHEIRQQLMAKSGKTLAGPG